MKFRIIEKDGNFYGQCKSDGLFSKWMPFLTYSGLSEAFPYSSYDSAMEMLLTKVRDQCIVESRGFVDSIDKCDVQITRYSDTQKTYVLTKIHSDFDEVIDAGQDLSALMKSIDDNPADEYESYHIYSFPGNEQVYPLPVKRLPGNYCSHKTPTHSPPDLFVVNESGLTPRDILFHIPTGSTWVVVSLSGNSAHIFQIDAILPMDVQPKTTSEFIFIGSSVAENATTPKSSEGKVFDGSIAAAYKKDEEGQR
jgi:hypothetical protein